MVATLSAEIKQEFGYLGLFLIISAWGIVALLATLIYPKNPSPLKAKKKKRRQEDPPPPPQPVHIQDICNKDNDSWEIIIAFARSSRRPYDFYSAHHYCIPPFYVLCPNSYFVRTQKTWNNFLFTIHDDLLGFSHWKQICAKSFSGKIHRAAVPLCVISSLFRAGSSSRLLHTIRKFFFSALLQPVRVFRKDLYTGEFLHSKDVLYIMQFKRATSSIIRLIITLIKRRSPNHFK